MPRLPSDVSSPQKRHASNGTYSCESQMSAIVPPTMVHIDPPAPIMKRPTRTVPMFLALLCPDGVSANRQVHSKIANSRADHDVRDYERDRRDNIHWPPTNFLRKRRGEEGYNTEAERIHGKAECCEEARRMEIADHRRKARVVG
jgi:hypothetical protein